VNAHAVMSEGVFGLLHAFEQLENRSRVEPLEATRFMLNQKRVRAHDDKEADAF